MKMTERTSRMMQRGAPKSAYQRAMECKACAKEEMRAGHMTREEFDRIAMEANRKIVEANSNQ